MKRILLPLALLVFSAYTFTACTQTNDTNAQPYAAANSFSATINGNTWNSKLAGATLHTDSVSHEQVLFITGDTPVNDSVNQVVVLMISDYLGIKTYNITDTGTTIGTFYYGKPGAKLHKGKAGSITLTSASLTHVQGYYNMNTDSVNISSGAFSLDMARY